MDVTTRAQIINMVAADADLDTNKARKAIDAFLNVIKMQLRDHQDIRLTGFGSFKVRRTKPRMCRDFQTGEKVHSPGRSRTTFKQSSALRAIINAER